MGFNGLGDSGEIIFQLVGYLALRF